MCRAATACEWALQNVNALQRGSLGSAGNARNIFVPFMRYAG
jgi:hypothetical protein